MIVKNGLYTFDYRESGVIDVFMGCGMGEARKYAEEVGLSAREYTAIIKVHAMLSEGIGIEELSVCLRGEKPFLREDVGDLVRAVVAKGDGKFVATNGEEIECKGGEVLYRKV